MAIFIPKGKQFMLISLGIGNGHISYTQHNTTQLSNMNLCARIYSDAWLFIGLISWTSRGMLNYAYVPWNKKKKDRTNQPKKENIYMCKFGKQENIKQGKQTVDI